MEVPEGYAQFLAAMESLAEIQIGMEAERQAILMRLHHAKSGERPRKLYHYTSPQGLSGILQANCLWATDYRSLNDSMELQYGTQLLVEQLEAWAEQAAVADAWLLRQVADLLRSHGDTYFDFFETYILSFSEASDVLSQWRAYADQARGHCLEFDFSDSSLFSIVDNSVPLGLELLPVIYEPEIQKAVVRAAIEKILIYLRSTEWAPEALQMATQEHQGAVVGTLLHAFSPIISSFKHPGFAEEREWRAVASCAGTMTTEAKKKRPSASGEVMHLECIFIQGDEERLWQRSHLPISGIKHAPLAGADAKRAADALHRALGYERNVAFSSSAIPLKA